MRWLELSESKALVIMALFAMPILLLAWKTIYYVVT